MNKKFKIYSRKIRFHGIMTLSLMCVYLYVCIFCISGIFHEIFLLCLPMYIYIVYIIRTSPSINYKKNKNIEISFYLILNAFWSQDIQLCAFDMNSSKLSEILMFNFYFLALTLRWTGLRKGGKGEFVPSTFVNNWLLVKAGDLG